MTEQEVDDIVLISSEQATKFDFYEKMKPEACPKYEYQKALLASYERLEKYLNEIDPFHFQIIKHENGEIIEFEDMSPEFYQKAYWSNLNYLDELGTVTTPFKKKIRIWNKETGNLEGTFELSDLQGVKDSLYNYCSIKELKQDKKASTINSNKSSEQNKVKKIIQFPEYLILEEYSKLDLVQIRHQQKKLAAICKRVFGIQKSPTIYAMMFCILTEKKIINVSNRSDFFRSWYKFLGEKCPENFEAINKPIREKFEKIAKSKYLSTKQDKPNKPDKDSEDYSNKKAEFENEVKKG